MNELVFLTRDGCVNTPTMRAHFDEALQSLGQPAKYTLVNLGALEASDARRGYPTPTLLCRGIDAFGMANPAPPFPAPT